MKRITLKCLVVVLLFLFPAVAASCGQSRESSAAADATQPTLSAAPSETTAGVSDPSAISPAPAYPPAIVFEMPQDRTNVCAKKLYMDANETSVLVIGGEKEPVYINGTAADFDIYSNSISNRGIRRDYAMDGSSLVILLDSNSYGSGRLVYCDGKTAVDIASDVDSFCLSGDGSAVLYLVTSKYEHGIGGDLYYYDCAAGKSQLITKGAGRLFTISPCGKSISYTTFYKVDDPDALTCCSMTIGQTPVPVAADSYCIALSDDARIVYYLTKTAAGEILNVRYDGVSRQLSLPYTPQMQNFEKVFFFNVDQTQIVFNSDGAAYFSMSGSDPCKISDSPARSLTWNSGLSNKPICLYKTITDSARSYITASIFGTKNLCYVPIETEDPNLLFFDENMKVTEYTMFGYWYSLLFPGNTLVACASEGYTIFQDYWNEEPVTIQNISSPLITENHTFYYLSYDEDSASETDPFTFTNELYAVYGSYDTAKAELIAPNVSYFQSFEKDGADILYYLACPEDHNEEVEQNNTLLPFLDLYAVEEIPGARPVLVAEQVCSFDVGDFGVVYWKYKGPYNGDFESPYESYMCSVGIYSSQDGESFQYVMDKPYINPMGG